MNAAARDPAQSGEGFSREDVQRRLPLVRSIVADIMRLHQDLTERRDRLRLVRRIPGKKKETDNVYEDELREIEVGIERDDETLNGFIEELDALGGLLCDAVTGCVEFPGHMDDGRSVFWGLEFANGESTYWRDAETDSDERHNYQETTIPNDETP